MSMKNSSDIIWKRKRDLPDEVQCLNQLLFNSLRNVRHVAGSTSPIAAGNNVGENSGHSVPLLGAQNGKATTRLLGLHMAELLT